MANYITNDLKIKSKTKKELIRFFAEYFEIDRYGRFYNINLRKHKIDTEFTSCFYAYETNIYSNESNKYEEYYKENIERFISKEKSLYIVKITFETKWSCPYPAIEKMSEDFKDLTIEVRYADEDIGCHCGEFSLKNKRFYNENIAPEYKEQKEKKERYKWLVLACDIKYGSHPAYRGYNEQGEYDEKIEQNPEEYIKKIEYKKKISRIKEVF